MNSRIVKSVFILSLLGMSFMASSAEAASKRCYSIVSIAGLVIPGAGEEIDHGRLNNTKCRQAAHKRRGKIARSRNFDAFVWTACNVRGIPSGAWTNLNAHWDRSRNSERRWKDSSGWRIDFHFVECP